MWILSSQTRQKARNSLIFQLSSRQIISTKLKFQHQSDATSWESNPVVSIMGWGGGWGRAAAPRRIISRNVVLLRFLVGDGDRALDSKNLLCCKELGRNYFWLCRVLSILSEEPVDYSILYNKSCFYLNWQEWIL